MPMNVTVLVPGDVEEEIVESLAILNEASVTQNFLRPESSQFRIYDFTMTIH